MPKPSRADYAFAAALLKLPEPQRSKAFVKLVDDLNDTLPPAECLAALYRKKKREQDLKRFAELDIHSKNAVFLALSRGDDPEPFLPPAPDGAGYPEDGHNGPTNPPAGDPFRGRLIRLGEMSEEYTQPLHRGTGGSMYTRKAHATREAPLRDQG